MSEEKELILVDAIRKLQEYKDRTAYEIEQLEKKKQELTEVYDELLNEDPKDFENEEIRALKEIIKNEESTKDDTQELMDIFQEEMNFINSLLNYNLKLEGVDKFRMLIGKIKALETENGAGVMSKSMFSEFQSMEEITGIPFPFSLKDIEKINKTYKEVEMGAVLIDPRGPSMSINLSEEQKMKQATQIKQNLMPLYNFYKQLIPYMKLLIVYTDETNEHRYERIEEIKRESVEQKRDGIKEIIDEIEEKIKEREKSLETTNNAFELYDTFKETGDQKTLLKLSSLLINSLVLSTRDAKLMTYTPTEKEKEVEEAPKVEEKPLEEIKPVELDNDYFRNKDTNYIVCFLGEEGDTINEDINNHFDKSKVKPVLSELFTLFTVLTTTNDYIKDKGGNPHEGSSKKALSLLRSPLDFAYKRFGVRNDKFRIHAISRNSSLLKELGFGSGNIIFFGAVGVNDDKEKSDAYNRVGKRAIDSLSKKNEAPKLRPNFDFIEHITRGYVPKKLFSEADLEKASRGDFNRRLKGNIEMSIEHGRFVLYSILDDTTKSNVKKWLEEYFIKQTTTLFEIKSRYEKVSGNTFD